MEFIAKLMPVVLVVVALFAFVVGAMALGQRLTGRCLKGSCGGPKPIGPDGKPIVCVGCPNTDKHTH